MKLQLAMPWMRAAFFMLNALFIHSAKATLGQGVDSIESDVSTVKASRLDAVQHEKYVAHPMVSGNNKSTEFSDVDGTVFAVTASGRNPHVELLLGDFLGEYRQAVAEQPVSGGRAPVVIKTENLEIHFGGHMGNVFQTVISVKHLPTGMQANEIHN